MKKCPYGYTVPTEFFLRGAKECPFLPQKESGTQPASAQQLKPKMPLLEEVEQAVAKLPKFGLLIQSERDAIKEAYIYISRHFGH